MGIGVAACTAAPFLYGCATDPVTGRQVLMMVSEEDEIALDKQQSPYQFSNDYGSIQDAPLNSYISQVGKSLASQSHRPHMPFSFRGVNAAYINAYAFPGGSIAVTRGILVELENEAELAALLGHEIGHVNARHTAEQLSSSKLTQALLTTASLATSAAGYGGAADLVQGLGGLGAGALLAKYSRDNEREADALGMEYMTRAGYTPRGMIGLMEVLLDSHERNPSAVEMMFATHPMSNERHQTAIKNAENKYADRLALPEYKERYMDNTAKLRSKKSTIKNIQAAEKDLRKKNPTAAAEKLDQALKQSPNDYAALLMMAKCQVALDKVDQAERYALQATEAYPAEAQAHQLSGILSFENKRYAMAYKQFNEYDRILPGNPQIIFYRGLSLEGMEKKQEAARDYSAYLKKVRQGKPAQYAYQRLKEWGYIKK